MRVGVVGMGWVGSSVAASVLQRGFADELLLCDARTGLAEGEAMDFSHGASFLAPCAVRAVDLPQMRDLDVVVIAAGRGGTADESRLHLLRDNVSIVAGIAEAFSGSACTLVVVTNPVDVLTRVAHAASGLPTERVIGTGTMLETARLRYVVGRDLGIDPRSIHVQVLGEHGDSGVPVWSGATIGGKPLRAWPGVSATEEARWAEEVRVAAYEIIRRKGATNHAIGLLTATLLDWMHRGADRILTVSRVQPAFEGIALSMPARVGPRGATEVLHPKLDDEEQAALERSAGVLRAAYAELT